MKNRGITRRRLFKGSAMAAALAGTAAYFGPWTHTRVLAQGQRKPIKIGFTCDASGQYGDSGQDDLRGCRMAIDEFNAKGGVLGRRVEGITADTETNPATGSRIAERFITRDECGFLIGAVHSGVANAITQVAAKYGTIYLNTNSSAPSEAGENCNRVKFVWDGNGSNFASATVSAAVKSVGRNWLLLTNDYVWGHTTSNATKAMVEKLPAARSSITCWSPRTPATSPHICLKIQQTRKPDVVATAIGGDDMKALRTTGHPAQARRQASLDQQPARLAGHLGRGCRQPVRRLRDELVPQAAAAGRRGVRPRSGRRGTGAGAIPVPGNVSYNGYMATRELLRAIERDGGRPTTSRSSRRWRV